MKHQKQIIQSFVRYAPELVDSLKHRLNLPHHFSNKELMAFARHVEWAGRLDRRLSEILASGGLALLDSPDSYQFYIQKVKIYGQYGVIQGMAIAKSLYRVLLRCHKKTQITFLQAIENMRQTGPHTLTAPFNVLCDFLDEPDQDSADRYIELLHQTFSQTLRFQESQTLSQTIPECCAEMHKDRRLYQMHQLSKIISVYPQWVSHFAKGMQNGLNILSESALEQFIQEVITRYENNPENGALFLTIESELAQNTYRELQSVVALSQIIQPLIQYVQARTGLPLNIRPISNLENDNKAIQVCTDGKTIYLPDEMGIYSSRRDNVRIYKCLLRFEAGLCEYHTFRFDLEKVLEHIGKPDLAKNQDLITPDPQYFFSLFQHPTMAKDLFNVIEQGRIRLCLSKNYPGMIRHAMPMIQKEAVRMLKLDTDTSPIFYLYARIALNLNKKYCRFTYDGLESLIQTIVDELTYTMDVENAAALVYKTFPSLYQWYRQNKMDYKKLNPPFGRKISIGLYYTNVHSFDIRAKIIRQKLKKMEIPIYQSDIRTRLEEKNGVITIRDIRRMYKQRTGNQLDMDDTQIGQLFEKSDRAASEFASPCKNTYFTYKEWDCNLCDYLPAHTRVYCKSIDSAAKGLYFYELTLKRYRGILKRIRRSFELLRPQGMVFLRQWCEGDEFDYRALIEYAVDRKIRQTPCDRLYIKHVKQQRDVSVFLLIDLSKSTGFRISGSHQRILQVEKEAIVLFCEALQQSGDRFAIAAFSGLGRQCVDFINVKSFDAPHSTDIKRRISALSPCRSTRMGAAVRHATSQILQTPSKVRLLIILSDGLPNDLDYKNTYAISDTRMAIRETRALNIYVHGITVNVQASEDLDTLYGKGKHTLIQDVRELPDKLPVIYRQLTG